MDNETTNKTDADTIQKSKSMKEYLKGASDSILFRILLIGFLILLLLIPSAMIRGLIKERQKRKQEVIEEVWSKWAGTQTIGGPVLTVPLSNGDRAHFMPGDLSVKGKIIPEIRKRGIYKSIVYTVELDIEGTFNHPDFKKLDTRGKKILWEKASVAFGLSDLRGINKNIIMTWNDTELNPEPGLQHTDLFTTGVYTYVPLPGNGAQNTFSMQLSIKGSNSLFFLPIGKQTRIHLDSPWPSPSFTGKFLPKESAITDDGFSSDWEVFDYNRNFPQMWINQKWSPGNSYFGVELITVVDEYKKTERSTKYAILFIFLTFLTFFLFIEIFSRKRIHPIQYLLVGFGLTIFYLLLLSLSEHLPFDLAYVISSLAVIIMTSLYSGSISRKVTLPFIMGGLVSALYAFLYVILQLEEYSLIMGSIGLFIILGVVMFVTRKINFYTFSLSSGDDETKK